MEAKVGTLAVGGLIPLGIYKFLDWMITDVGGDFTPFLVTIAILFIAIIESKTRELGGTKRHPIKVGIIIGIGLGCTVLGFDELSVISAHSQTRPILAELLWLVLTAVLLFRMSAYLRQRYYAINWD